VKPILHDDIDRWHHLARSRHKPHDGSLGACVIVEAWRRRPKCTESIRRSRTATLSRVM